MEREGRNEKIVAKVLELKWWGLKQVPSVDATNNLDGSSSDTEENGDLMMLAKEKDFVFDSEMQNT